MRIIPVPCLKDNYAYLVICPQTRQAGIVDPSEAAPVLQALAREDVTPVAILNTHHHWDHVGGNKELLQHFPALSVYGHVSDRGRIEGQTDFLHHGDEFSVGQLKVHVLHNPGHTTGAVSYVVNDAVFTGDTLFAGGCGRIFEGTPAMMYTSLCEVIGALPPETRVYFGHEYTEANLRCAAHVEPDNAAVQQRLAAVQQARQAGQGTTPSTLAEEWRTNPFMRHDSATLQATVRKEDPANNLAPVDVLTVVREMKNRF